MKFNLKWCRRELPPAGQCLLLSFLVALAWTSASADEDPAAVETSASAPDGGHALEEARVKRHSEHLQEDLDKDYVEARDKKTPRGFLGMRGKKIPRNFLGIRGRRQESGEDYPAEGGSSEALPPLRLGSHLQGAEGDVLPVEVFKRAPPSGFLGLRGKKAPSGFLGMRGKKAPSGFLGMRGKKVPSSFLGLRGKKDSEDYQQVEDVLQALRQRYNNQDLYEQDKRTPRGFLGMRGKKSEDDVMGNDYYSTNQEPLFHNIYSDVIDDVMPEKRAPSRFLGLRG